jgi:cytochrome c oxidase subunit 3
MSSLVNKRNRALKMMLWFGIGSLFMTFAGLTSAFIVSKNREDWVQNFDLPEAFYYSLIFMLSSSIILIFARRLLIKNQQKKVSVLLLITILLGTLFIVFQFLGFGQIMADGYHFTGPTSTINSSFIFLIAFVHLVHVLVALLALIVVFVKNLKGVYNHENYTGFDLASIFWHFVDILWIYLFIFLVFFG